MSHQPLDPRICPVAIDTNALNRDGGPQDDLVDRLLALWSAGRINLLLPHGVRQEILAPQTPTHIKKATQSAIFTTSVGRTADEKRRLHRIEAELQGNAREGKHAVDAAHLFEAAKYAGYFITHDQRILKRVGNLGTLLPSSLSVVTLRRFFEIYDCFTEMGRR